jgi:hypothetical protein
MEQDEIKEDVKLLGVSDLPFLCAAVADSAFFSRPLNWLFKPREFAT